MSLDRFNPFLPLFHSGHALTYNQILKAWPGSPHHEAYGRSMATAEDVYSELKSLVRHGILVEGKRENWGTWKLAKR